MGFIHQKARAADFLLSEANGQRSRENIIISAGAGKLEAGTILAKITATNAGTVTAGSGNTGNGVFGAVTVSSEAVSGTYTVTITEAAAGGGEYLVTGPAGLDLGTGTVGAPFSAAGLSFSIADGSTDFAEGDSWTIAVLANLGEYLPYDDDGTDDGRRTASAVLYAGVDATLADAKAVGIVRDAEVVAGLLIGLDAAGGADLQALGVIIRQ